MTAAVMLVCVLSLLLCFAQGWSRSAAGMDLPWYVVGSRFWLDGVNPYDSTKSLAHPPLVPARTQEWSHAIRVQPQVLVEMAPLALLSWPVALKAWWIVSFLCLLVTLACLVQLFGPTWTLAEQLLFAALIAQSRLIQSAAYRGQTSLFCLALVLLALLAARRGRPAPAGVALGLAALKISLVPPAILYWIWKREWRAIGWSVATMLVLNIGGALRLGFASTAHAMPALLRGWAILKEESLEYNGHVVHWQAIYATVFGQTSRITTLLNLATLLGMSVLLVIVCRRRQRTDPDGWILMAMVMFVMTAMYHRVYDGVFLFILAAGFYGEFRQPDRRRDPALWAAGVTLSLVLFVFAAQNVSLATSTWLSVRPVLWVFSPVNAWLYLLLLAQTIALAYRHAPENVTTASAA